MSAKEELTKYKYLSKRADFVLKKKEEILVKATKMTTTFSDTVAKTNKIGDKVGDGVAKLEELERIYMKLYFDAEMKCVELLDKINQLEEPHSSLLRERYLDITPDNKLKSFEEVAVAIGYSYSQTTTLHGEALEIYEKKFLS